MFIVAPSVDTSLKSTVDDPEFVVCEDIRPAAHRSRLAGDDTLES
jgi:hypothetical protein